MYARDSFSDSVYEEQTCLAERELSAFLAAVTELYGPGQVRPSAEAWLDESDLMDSPPRSEARNWRSVTIAATARIASQVRRRSISGVSTLNRLEVTAIRSSNCAEEDR